MITTAHIGINAQLLSGQAGYRQAGIHQYIVRLLEHLPLEEAGNRYTIFTGSGAPLAPAPGRSLVTSGWPTERPLFRILWEQLAWPLTAVRRRLDLLHSMAFVTPILSPCPSVVTVYDLSFIHYPDLFPPLQRLYLTSQTRRSCRAARRVITISESGRQDVHRYFNIPLDRIDVVYPGVDAQFCPRPQAETAAFRQREGLPSSFILHVGTLQPRKNIPLLIDAFARLVRQEGTPADFLLVLVGGKGWLYDEIFARVEELGIQQRVRFTGYVADSDLPLWYNAASLLVFPSVYEGFGMPVVQAMACGTPVIAADTSAVPEATGQAALLFDPQDVVALTSRMADVLHGVELAATMRQGGFMQAQQFSWELSGRKMAAVYGRALSQQ